MPAIVFIALLIGCTRLANNEDATAETELATAHDPDDVPITEADVKMPRSYEEAIDFIERHLAAIRTALTGGRPGKAHRPMDELGVTGKDDTLCSDRWYSCTTYDRQQFDQKYPGQRLKDMLRFGEPDWPDKPRSCYGSRKSDRSDRMDHGERFRDLLDKY